MGLFSNPDGSRKSAKESAKTLFLDTPKQVLGWARDRIQNLFRKADNLTSPLARGIVTLSRNRVNEVSKAEGLKNAEKREERVRKWESTKDIVSRGDFKAFEYALQDELNIAANYKHDIDPILSLKDRFFQREDWMFVKDIAGEINTRLKKNFTLLPSNHELTKIARQQAQHIAHKPEAINSLTPLRYLRYPYLVPGHGFGESEKGKYYMTKEGPYKKNIWGREKFKGLTNEERRQAVGPPEILSSKTRHRTTLDEEQIKFLERHRKATEERRKLSAATSPAFTLSLSTDDMENFPNNGDASEIFRLLQNRYADILSDKKYSQMALGTAQIGKQLILVGYLTSGREMTLPDPMDEPLPSPPIVGEWWYDSLEDDEEKNRIKKHISDYEKNQDPSKYKERDSDWWYDLIPKHVREDQKSLSWKLFHGENRFLSGLSAFSCYQLESYLNFLAQEKDIEVSIGGTQIQRQEEVENTRLDTLHIEIKYPSGKETVKLIKGTDTLIIPENSVVKDPASDVRFPESKYMRVRDYIHFLGKLVRQGAFPLKPLTVSGSISADQNQGQSEKPKPPDLGF